MNASSTIPTSISRFVACIAATAACAVVSAPVQAKSHEVTVTIAVSTAGLDLRRPADARKLYARLRFAAETACTNANIVGLEPVINYRACYERALADAVRSAHRPQLSLAYLEAHAAKEHAHDL